MRIVFCFALIIALSLAVEIKNPVVELEFNEKVNNMMTSNSAASDSVDTVERLLKELRDSIYTE